jgi:hypothetical protein
MWQCSPFNAVMPVPTYHLEDGPSSHTHSPGKKSQLLRNLKSQGFPPVVANTVFPPVGNDLLDNAALQMPYLDSSTLGSGTALSCSDPFLDSAYLEWANSLTNQQSSDSWDGKTLWPASARSSQRRSTSDTIMPDYVPPHPSDPMHISGDSLEDCPMTLKVPTNTPTGGPAEEGQDTYFRVSEAAGLPQDFASSLTRSLLNQPFPLPVQHHNQRFPGAEAQSNKDSQAVPSQSNTFSQSTAQANKAEICKDSQQLFSPNVVDITVPVSASSEPSSGEFGSMIASLGCDNNGSSLATPTSSGQRDGGPGSGQNGGGKGGGAGVAGTVAKRPRNFTPASVKAIDEEDEPRRMSPHVRPAGFGVVDLLGDVGA